MPLARVGVIEGRGKAEIEGLLDGSHRGVNLL